MKQRFTFLILSGIIFLLQLIPSSIDAISINDEITLETTHIETMDFWAGKGEISVSIELIEGDPTGFSFEIQSGNEGYLFNERNITSFNESTTIKGGLILVIWQNSNTFSNITFSYSISYEDYDEIDEANRICLSSCLSMIGIVSLGVFMLVASRKYKKK